jgi:enamine deaminase RidA (YjgF/YER057c/UK114 family)
MKRQCYSSGTPWEAQAAYSRAVRVGPLISVSGTTASNSDGSTAAPGNAYEQTRIILRKIELALAQLGARLSDVVRTRMFVVDLGQWPDVARAHQEAFAGINPAATLVEVRRLINPDHLVEIEADAVVQDGADHPALLP